MAAPEDNVDKGLFEQDPHVDQLRPEPSAPPSDVVILEGLAGKSDREGWARLYFNRELTYYAEFRREDIVFTEAIPPDQPPMLGLKGTRVGIKKDAVIEYTRTTRAKAADEFDLDVQLAAGPQGAAQPNIPASLPEALCPITVRGGTCLTCDTCRRTDCDQATCDTCRTQCGTCQTCNTCQTQCHQATCQTCNTCQTQCGQATCQTCNTCQTQCHQATCQTCRTQCGQVTCNTCRTLCEQATCDTCRTCDPDVCFITHAFTCRPGCRPNF